MHNFCIVDLGGFYLDIVRDRLYTTPAGSHARRSAQTAMWHIAEAMVRWLAPILSFTAEEIWRQLPGAQGDSVFLAHWHALPEGAAHDIDWTAFLISLKRDVSRELEQLREARQIGAPLDARSRRVLVPAEFERFNALGAELRFLLITSEAACTRSRRRTRRRGAGHRDRTRGRVARGAGVEPRPSACAAGITAPMWAPIPRTRNSAAAASSNLAGPGEQRRFT